VTPTASVTPDRQRNALERILAESDEVRPLLEELAQERALRLEKSHDRVRHAVTRSGGAETTSEPEPPVEVLDAQVYLPPPGGAA